MRLMSKPTLLLKELKCSKCQTVRTICRRKNRNKSAGHHKHMFCHVCNKVSMFIEEE